MKNTKAELNDNEVAQVTGGIAHFKQLSGNLTTAMPQEVGHNMPHRNPDEKYIMEVRPTADDIIDELKS